MKIDAELDPVHQVPGDGAAFARGLEVQRALAHKGGRHHRRVGIADLLPSGSCPGGSL